jgi:ribose 5-phosphate isomerase B
MNIGIANDHRGLILKQKLTNFLKEMGYNIIDYGTSTSDSTDYPLYAFKVGEAIKSKEIDFGILICGTGIGMSIACNKVKNVRCARVCSIEDAYYSRLHNNANVIALSENTQNAEEIIKTFLNTKFSSEEKHNRRVEMINKYDN